MREIGFVVVFIAIPNRLFYTMIIVVCACTLDIVLNWAAVPAHIIIMWVDLMRTNSCSSLTCAFGWGCSLEMTAVRLPVAHMRIGESLIY